MLGMFKVNQKGQRGWSEVSEGNWWEGVGPDHIGRLWDITVALAVTL